jgi:hypothetical protein
MFCINYKTNHGRLYVAIFFMLIYNGSLAFMLFNKLQGWSPVLFRVMQDYGLLPYGSVIFLYFNFCGLHFNHLFIWLDPEVVAHELIATKSGIFFLFGLLEQYILVGWNLYRYSAKTVGTR